MVNDRTQTNAKGSKKASSEGNVDQIRDILFGSQMKDYDLKFSRLEERILQEVTNLKADTNSRQDNLELYIKTEMELVSKRLLTERNNREEKIKQLALKLEETAESIEKKLLLQETGTENDLRQLRQSLLDQSKTLLGEIGKKHNETMTIIKNSNSELREDKIDRSSLSSLLTDMALRLVDHPPLGDVKQISKASIEHTKMKH